MAYGLRTYMDLDEAIRISKNPARQKPYRLERALRILMRWAGEPCSDADYKTRLQIAARVFVPYRAWKDAIEAEQKRYERIIMRSGKKAKPPVLPERPQYATPIPHERRMSRRSKIQRSGRR
jgi:hypothetical protein